MEKNSAITAIQQVLTFWVLSKNSVKVLYTFQILKQSSYDQYCETENRLFTLFSPTQEHFYGILAHISDTFSQHLLTKMFSTKNIWF